MEKWTKINEFLNDLFGSNEMFGVICPNCNSCKITGKFASLRVVCLDCGKEFELNEV